MKLWHTEKPRVVIDTNIIISAPLSKESSPAKIFELLLVEEIENYTSEEIIKEIKGVFKREKIKSKLSQDKINFIIEKNIRIFSPKGFLEIYLQHKRISR